MAFGRDVERAHVEELLDAVAAPAGAHLEGTPAQARMEPVAAALTNPQIARGIHMGLRTVEPHLKVLSR